MGCGGCGVVGVGLLITIIAGCVFPPLGLIGIAIMFVGWKGVACSWASAEQREANEKPKDPKIML